MQLQDLSDRAQDYLKALWDLGEHNGGAPAPLSELAARLGQKMPTASEAVKRLAAKGLVKHTPYSGIELSEEGRRLAIEVVRRHRLLETFLVEKLGYTWDEVHDDADRLEHGCSERFINRIGELLGNPTRDPHGDPIPTSAGVIEDLGLQTLAGVEVGQTVTVERFCDGSPELLRYAFKNGLGVGSKATVVEKEMGLIKVDVEGRQLVFGDQTAEDITVS
ncbi:hypothetical protein CPHO_01770 [Corynebacterium phocae]|uniref:Diphtheria toxin repressor n=1 Tax=Corynebacterium phocae TaxID=161895 RepID=A0A1L7D124_9CORY|nr:metal-dependent transcriptional regulator [Corynebacterium phocae]APT91845.1 hypothetical protein CPHO_01770 [Corynebacterium phocae]KAA8727455.1 metal-dependent transcriptional regulator [Corynebacterium phocae]